MFPGQARLEFSTGEDIRTNTVSNTAPICQPDVQKYYEFGPDSRGWPPDEFEGSASQLGQHSSNLSFVVGLAKKATSRWKVLFADPCQTGGGNNLDRRPATPDTGPGRYQAENGRRLVSSKGRDDPFAT
jgi:hypothetical protein